MFIWAKEKTSKKNIFGGKEYSKMFCLRFILLALEWQYIELFLWIEDLIWLAKNVF